MPHKKNELGIRYGRLIVVDEAFSVSGDACWRCKCDCGNYTTVMAKSLRNGDTKSCGCYRREHAATVQQKIKNARKKSARQETTPPPRRII